MPMTVAQIKAHSRATQVAIDAGLPPPPPIPYAVGAIGCLPDYLDDREVYNDDEPTPMSLERHWVYYPPPDPAVGKMKEFLIQQQCDEDTPPSSPRVTKSPSTPRSSSVSIEKRAATSSPLSSLSSLPTDQEDYFGPCVKREQESQAEQNLGPKNRPSSPTLASDEASLSLTQDLPKFPPSILPSQTPSAARRSPRNLKRKTESSTPAPKKFKTNAESIKTSLSAVLKQEAVELEPKPLGRLARDIGHKVRKGSTRTTKKKSKQAAIIRAKDLKTESIKAEEIKAKEIKAKEIKAEDIKTEDIKVEIKTSHEAQLSLSKTEDDAMESDQFEDAVEYMQDLPSPPYTQYRRYRFPTLQTARYPRYTYRNLENPEQSKRHEPYLRSRRSNDSKPIKGNIEKHSPTTKGATVKKSIKLERHMQANQTQLLDTPGPNRKVASPSSAFKGSPSKASPPTEKKALQPQPAISTPNARLTRSRTSDDAKFMALDSGNTPTNVDNILLDLESIDRQHRSMMKMRRQAKARREERVN